MRWFGLLPLNAVLLLAACGSDGGADAAEPHELTVSAAASLADAFTDIGRAFEDREPGATVTFNFGPSDGLAGQIKEGAPVDVFASASPTWMDSVQEEGPGVSGRADFARNRLAIVVPADNPAEIEGLDDLAEDDVKLVLAAEGVPVGDYARGVLANAGIDDATLANVVSNEEDAAAVLTKVLSGDADAGIVYVTDRTPDVADEVSVVEIPDDVNVIATYSIAVVTGAQEADLAQRFVDFVLDDGQETLAAYGFLPAS
ncbi:MAG TPA: molybdate ABC transporter substrate-binding protein [Actinomycetota bacterium]|nr:molybdate ABC transporter substrate-binding protein [Actinomycetota bacterium]